jgi:hypothetical protein
VIPSSVVTPGLSGGSWLSALPLANLQGKDVSLLARSTDALAASTVINIDLGAVRDIRVMAILRHNLSLSATVQFQFYSDSGYTTLVGDSGALPVWLPFYPPGSLNWGHVSLWDGMITAEDQNGYQFDFIRALPSPVIARYCQVNIIDTANPAGYVELGRCILSPAWQPPENLIYGATVGWNSSATSDRALGGRLYIDETAMWRECACTLEHLDDGVAMGCVIEMQRRLGKSGELLFVWDPDDTTQAMWQRSFLCNMADLTAIDYVAFGDTHAAFKLVEII